MSQTVAISATGLVRRFGATRAVNGVDLRLSHGEITALAGPDGAGKTTTIRMLAGLLAADEGRIDMDGEPIGVRSHSVRARIGYMPQQYCLYADLSIDENLRFFADLFGLSHATRRERVGRLLEVTRLGPFRDRRAGALSGGMYKKLALACALLHQPAVLLLDEPSNGVDPVSRRELWLLLHEFVTDGMAVLVATPYMDEAERCHRALLLHSGHVIARGSPLELANALDHDVMLVELDAGRSRRDALEAELEQRADVRSVSPHGSGLRVICDREQTEALASWLRSGDRQARVERSRANFEDVYLSALGELQADPSAAGRGGLHG